MYSRQCQSRVAQNGVGICNTGTATYQWYKIEIGRKANYSATAAPVDSSLTVHVRYCNSHDSTSIIISISISPLHDSIVYPYFRPFHVRETSAAFDSYSTDATQRVARAYWYFCFNINFIFVKNKIVERRKEVVCYFSSLEPIFVSYSYAKRLSKRAIGFSLSVIDYILKVTTESIARDKACVPRAH